MAIRFTNSRTSSTRIRTRCRSAIGTHRLTAKPLSNILDPHHKKYKSLYRTVDPKNPSAFWTNIDKYPWQSHPKRFRGPDAMKAAIFTEYSRRKLILITLFELLHKLPLHGINSLCWKPKRHFNPEYNRPEPHTTRESRRIMNVNGFDYMVDSEAHNNQYFHVRDVEHTIRPFRGRVKGDLYVGENLVRQDVSPIGSVRGVWNHAYPLNEGTNATTNDDFEMEHLAYRISNIQIYRPNVEGPFKNMVQGTHNFSR